MLAGGAAMCARSPCKAGNVARSSEDIMATTEDRRHKKFDQKHHVLNKASQ